MSAFNLITGSGTVTTVGHERDFEISIERNIIWKDVVGGPPRGVPKFYGAGNDIVTFNTSLWLQSSQASTLEQYLPPYGPGGTTDLQWYTNDSTNSPVPGFANYNSGTGIWSIVKATLDPLDSSGRKAPATNLYGYKLSGSFAANGYGTALNERGGIVPSGIALPSIIQHKFTSHQIQDASRSPRPLPVSGASIPIVQHGRRYDATIQLDHVDVPTMDTIVNWFRSVRMSSFSLSGYAPFGPANATTVNAVATALSIRIGAGWWWEGELSVSLFR